ncbi:MAG: rhodanese-like domain-containing protein [Dehalococcoidales bacterium]
MSLRIFIVSVLLALISLAACGPTPPPNLPTSPDEVPRISIEELLKKMDNGTNILIVDTRSESEYLAGHIKGAVSVTYTTIAQEEWQPPGDREIVLYCA